MRIAILLLTLLALCQVRFVVAGEWMDAPYGNTDYNVRAQYGDNATLSCDDGINNNNNNNTVNETLYWILPDLTVMHIPSHIEFTALDGLAAWEVTNDGLLHVILVQEKHFGFYHCVRTSSSSEIYVTKKALNYKGPYFGSLWPVYRLNVIIGCSAGAACFALCTLILVAYECRLTTTRKEEEKELNDTLSPSFTPREGDKPLSVVVDLNVGTQSNGKVHYAVEEIKGQTNANTNF